MTPSDFRLIVLPAAMSVFPAHLSTPEAQALILAIGLQESDFEHRQQLIGNHRNWWESMKGPAVSFFQFERIGIAEVLRHHATSDDAFEFTQRLGYPTDVGTLWEALKHNDLLAAGFARLALRRVPEALPGPQDVDEGWKQYLQVWRPGKPRPERWHSRYRRAWGIVKGLNL